MDLCVCGLLSPHFVFLCMCVCISPGLQARGGPLQVQVSEDRTGASRTRLEGTEILLLVVAVGSKHMTCHIMYLCIYLRICINIYSSYNLFPVILYWSPGGNCFCSTYSVQQLRIKRKQSIIIIINIIKWINKIHLNKQNHTGIR